MRNISQVSTSREEITYEKEKKKDKRQFWEVGKGRKREVSDV
jgi:hypothetical protein